MKNIAANELGPIQNIGLVDRTVRIAIGMALILGVVTNTFGHELNFIAILAVYPCLTGMFGWDPLYSFRRVKSCDITQNKCGTYTFQVKSAAGEEMACNDGYDCSVSGHKKVQAGK
ncbi:DUF2892 domain-containing protein [Pseudomonadota bacterium]